MKLLGIIFEDFINYRKPAMILEFPYCDLKCDKECGIAVCQNSPLLKEVVLDVDISEIITNYIQNPISKAIIMQGMEPMLSFEEMVEFIAAFREKSEDDIIIFTGYREEEISDKIDILKKFKNIYIKYGRFIPNRPKIHNDLLGIELASDNQYVVKIC